MESTAKMPVTREDLFQFQFLSEASLSPDEKKVVYVVNQADKEENCYHSSIWCIDLETKENRLLAARGNAKAPIWLDSETILFASGREQEEAVKDKTVYYKISLNGGEACQAMTVPVKVEKLKRFGKDWLVMATAQENKKEEDGEYEACEGKDYYIYEELPFWFNGKGIRSRKRTVLYLFEEDTETLTRITPQYLETISFDVSSDGTKVVYCGPIYDSVMPRSCGLYLYDAEQGESRKLVQEGLYDINQVCFMGNDKIFYTAYTYERVGRHPRFYLYHLSTGTANRLPYCDSSIGNTVGSDARFGTGNSIAYCPKRERLYLLQTCWGDCKLMAMDNEGLLTEVSKASGAVSGFDVKGDTLLLTAMRGQSLTELYQISLSQKNIDSVMTEKLCLNPEKEEKLTGFNDNYLESHSISVPEPFRYQGKNGYEMEGYVIKPIDYQSGKKYPAVLEIHGGPKTASGSIFFHEYQCLSSDGYFVIYGNPRGSDGRGEAFADITEVFGKDDFEDLMELTDQALAHYPDIDENKIGICGGSYGGFMCNWMVGHTDRYAAAVSQRSISNYLTKCLYTDIGYYANRLQMGAYPWEDFHKVWSMSPLSGAANAKTPLLLLQSDEDYRCWMGDAIQMFSAVKRQGTDSRLVLFHGENHELSRSGKPVNRITRLKELEQWFEKYLKN